MNLFYQPQLPHIFYLDPEESRHCSKVLRKKQGDLIDITDGKGTFYKASIIDPDPTKCTFNVEHVVQEPGKNFYLHIGISPTKNTDRIEWFVEKAVEIGIDEITFIDCEHTERVRVKPDRLNKIAISAMKQSLKATLPRVHEVVSFNDFLTRTEADAKYIAFVDESNPVHLTQVAGKGVRTVILIGPEGDFSTNELTTALRAGYQKISLGKSRLRTETAGIVACHTLNLINL